MAKSGVIMLAHGSRLQEANEEVLKLAPLLGKAGGNGLYCGVSFLQGGEPGLDEAVNKAVEKGCTTIYVVPFFLTSGVHIREDLPQMLEKSREAHPEIKLVQCRPMGCDHGLIPILWERVKEKMTF